KQMKPMRQIKHLSPPPTDTGEAATPEPTLKPGRRNMLMAMSALLGTPLLPVLSACGGGGGDTVAASSARQGSPSLAGAPSPASTPSPGPTAASEAQVSVTFRNLRTARRIDSRFAGLSYE